MFANPSSSSPPHLHTVYPTLTVHNPPVLISSTELKACFNTSDMSLPPGTESIRFAKREKDPSVKKNARILLARHDGLLQDQVRRCVHDNRHSQNHNKEVLKSSRRSQRAPWCPSFSLALRILLLVRVSGAMYSNISDCDEGAKRYSSTPTSLMSCSVQFLGTIALSR
jgi:hypothetical protein